MLRRHPPATTSRPASRGYALVLVMVALVTLTILGVTQITATQLDMTITQNFRHHKQLQYGAMTGSDHAIDLFESLMTNGSWVFDTWETAWDTSGHCTTGWISSTSVNSADTPVAVMANTYMLANYETDLCAVPCGAPPAGFDASAPPSGAPPWRSFVFDMRGTGSMTNATADAQSGQTLLLAEQAFCK